MRYINQTGNTNKRGSIADHTEVLEFFTAVMRRTAEDEITVQNKRKITRTGENGDKINDEETEIRTFITKPKLSDAMTAADKLHRYYCQKAEEDNTGETGVVILPEINKEGSDKK